jgi:superfamily II DNA or RNA helicase
VPDLTVTKKDEVYLNIESDPSIASELNDYFTFDVPGARFMPTYKAKMWDGKARMFNMWTKELYVGLLPYLREFAARSDYEMDVNMDPIGDPVDIEYLEEFAESLNLTSQGSPIQAREYQIDAVKYAIRIGRTLLLSPTASGKSLIIYLLLRYHQQFNRKQLVIVPTTSLVEQMYGDFADYSHEDGTWHVANNCSKIYAGFEKSNQANIVISTWQSIYKLPKKFFDEFDVIYGDEAHLFKAKSLTSIFNKCTKTKFRIGTTGTLDGTKTHKLILEGLFGKVHRVITTKELMDNKDLAELKITCLLLDYSDETKKAVKGQTYQEEMDWLVKNHKRNVVIRNLSVTQKGNTLVLFQFVEKHGDVLYQMIKEKAGTSRKVFFVYGGTDTAQREQIRSITEKESDAIIVASYGTFSTGINIRNLHNVVFASPSKSRIRNLQSIGRGLRKGNQKERCNLFDVGDDLSWKSKKNYTLNHMVERIKIYNEEGFNYKIVRLPIDD